MSWSFDGFVPAYGLPVLAGLMLTLLFPASRAIADPVQRKRYRGLQVVTLVSAIVGAKLGAVVGEWTWPLDPSGDPHGFLMGGRSLVGALLFGFAFAELAKPLFRYRERPNDRFAMILPFSVAIGRVGCLLAGCCQGVAYEGPLSTVDAAGVHRHPMPLYEIAFHLTCGIAFIALVRRGAMKGRVFALYLVLYGVFRFFMEYLREAPVLGLGLTGYQLLCFALVGAGAIGLFRRFAEGEVAVSQLSPAEGAS